MKIFLTISCLAVCLAGCTQDSSPVSSSTPPAHDDRDRYHPMTDANGQYHDGSSSATAAH